MPKPYRNGRLFIFAFFIAGPFLYFSLPLPADAAASLYIAPAGGTFTVGSTFTASLFVNTGRQSINAVSASLRFPPEKLQVVSPSAGKSFVQVWVTQPSYSNTEGNIKLEGAVLNPGINTEAGLISTITFRVKKTGVAAVKISDESKVLLNDGKGTDVLGQTTDGIFNLVLPPPAGPIVISRTHPDQGKWYKGNSVVFEWNAPEDSEGYSYILSNNLVDDPDNIPEGIKTRVVYNNLADGVYYFHIKTLRQGAWGGVTDYGVNIDATPPAEFQITFSPSDRTANVRPIIDFVTTDAASGIDHYELKVIALDQPAALTQQNQTPFFIEAEPPYSTKLDYGRYNVVVRAYDQATNYFQTEARVTIAQAFFEAISGQGLKIGGVYTLGWPYVGGISLALIVLLGLFARAAWRWHRELEKQLEKGVLEHPDIAAKVEDLRKKQKEYGNGPGALIVLFASLLAISMVFGTAYSHAQAQGQENLQAQDNLGTQDGASFGSPVIAIFPRDVSNDEIVYIGGHAPVVNGRVIIYLQSIEAGNILSAATVTDKNGEWFYSFPKFLDAGNYVVWTQLKVGQVVSPPSARVEITVAPTALQIGKNRLNYQEIYLLLFLIFLAAFVGLLAFSFYHTYHFRQKRQRLSTLLREAEESVRRGFLLLRKDIESELAIVRRAKLEKEFSQEEKTREEKLLRDFEDVSRYVSREIWEMEKAESG